ncbi:hypothetical protein OQ252_11860 [Acetobacter farinalis]|uniref:Uncharacterized protein n=1 Tax=Acetobacter farinalis TaxID=1260984 RepID=A0ABT3Q9Y5_9PROT|nr:hypothetical protein [Acetobacter farinalis]MCX2562084.1 hypothetical protein [Acetobacter farinalis]
MLARSRNYSGARLSREKEQGAWLDATPPVSFSFQRIASSPTEA